ncbi:MAG: ABC transporter ATP-binding protein [Thermomicrobium sp.]|nr:ABC transporter ATP-binding protein [Thermomicrobium sp.]MDW8060552.1 ABC transporter ATP-binding protein [Thermomicrobium sp.]
MTGATVRLEGVRIGLGDHLVLSDVSLVIPAGSFLAIVGPSGVGKTTLLRALAGTVPLREGRLSIERPQDGSAPQVAFVFQEPRLLPWLRTSENVALVAPGRSASERRQRAYAALAAVHLPERAFSAWPRQLSGGMAQRAALARALVTEPDLLLLDEPFSAVDALTRLRLQDYLLELWERFGFTAVLVTHDVDEAVYLADRVVLLGGRPATVQESFAVDVPRPRDRGDARLAALRARVLGALDREAGEPIAAASGQ